MLNRDFKERGLTILGISVDTDRGAFDQAVLKNGRNWPQVFDPRGEKASVPKLFNASGVPVSLLVGRDGHIVGRNFKPDELRKQIEELLK